MIGKTISHFQILEKLGEGGMVVVCKARDTHLDRFVAIKILPPEKVADPERKKLKEESDSGTLKRAGVAKPKPRRRLIRGLGGVAALVIAAAARGSGQPQELTSSGQDAYSPAISDRVSCLPYTHSTFDLNIWRVEISSPQGKANPPTKFISSTRNEWGAHYSPDGKKIAFDSDRSGSEEMWVCDEDGSNAIQLTHVGKNDIGTAKWSPDSSRLAFDTSVEGHPEVYLINTSGGNPRRLTSSSGSENPSWSKDGRWIYFNSVGGGIQRILAEGGPAVVLGIDKTLSGPVESLDGKFIYLFGNGTDATNRGLWRVPVEGGESKQILDSLGFFDPYAVVDDGIYFIPRPGPARGYSIRFLELATGKIKTIAELGKLPSWSLSVSPVRRWVLYHQTDQSGSDLMLVENTK
jgi:Tol biopolymer transport system component